MAFFKKNTELHIIESQRGRESEEHLPGLSVLYMPEVEEDVASTDIAGILKDKGVISAEQFDKIQDEARRNPSFSSKDYLISTGLADAEKILEAEAELSGYEFRRLTPDDINPDVFKKTDIDYVRHNRIMCIGIEDGKLVLGTSQPENVFAIDDLKRMSEMEVKIVVCTDEDIDTICSEVNEADMSCNMDDLLSDMTEVEVVHDEEEESEDLEKMAAESPVIKFVNYLISSAIYEGASDIHIEPKEKLSKIRYRIDGILFEVRQAPSKMHPAIISRLKVMSNLDISERRLPQDGKISVKVGGKSVDLRVSTLPTSHGEKVVIRILERDSILRGLEETGMSRDILESFENQIKLPHGIMLVTGPTGSGKSTTLYSALGQMDGESLNISTVEDPVEYELGFCNQVQVNEKIGMTFSAALRSLLRQDPDIIMIGEIRDNETAKIAVQAALTGHLVLSTLHTNDAPASITRLVDIGIEPYLVAASLNGILAQRLVRRICTNCSEPYDIPEDMRERIEKTGVPLDKLMYGKGCDDCRGSGYSGRVGIHEFLIVDEEFRSMIIRDPSISSMRKMFFECGYKSLYQAGLGKVKDGLTTLEEVMRVTEAYNAEDSLKTS